VLAAAAAALAANVACDINGRYEVCLCMLVVVYLRFRRSCGCWLGIVTFSKDPPEAIETFASTTNPSPRDHPYNSRPHPRW